MHPNITILHEYALLCLITNFTVHESITLIHTFHHNILFSFFSLWKPLFCYIIIFFPSKFILFFLFSPSPILPFPLANFEKTKSKLNSLAGPTGMAGNPSLSGLRGVPKGCSYLFVLSLFSVLSVYFFVHFVCVLFT